MEYQQFIASKAVAAADQQGLGVPAQSRRRSTPAAGEAPSVRLRPDAPSRVATTLDVCCGSRMFWFDRKDDRALFMDNRREQHVLTDNTRAPGSRVLNVDPDIQADFTALPFADNSFPLVVFDPPHLVRAGKGGWLAKKYGVLGANWRDDLRSGFAECFRVLAPNGTLVFKWNEYQVPVSQILALTPERPLFGNRSGKQSKSHWIVFQKAGAPALHGDGLCAQAREGVAGKPGAEAEDLEAKTDGVITGTPKPSCLFDVISEEKAA